MSRPEKEGGPVLIMLRSGEEITNFSFSVDWVLLKLSLIGKGIRGPGHDGSGSLRK